MNDFVQAVYEFMIAADQPPRDFETAKVYEPIIAEEMREFWDGFELVKQNPLSHRARIEHLDGIVDTMWTLIAQALAMGYDIEGAMAEVARSNMSKVDGGVIRKTPSGKVIKPEGYSPPDLKGFV
jgi:predicted HAD superfamily Cof-like phosphohydrolase